MVTINCKDCSNDVNMPNRKFKICFDCKNKPKKNKKKEVVLFDKSKSIITPSDNRLDNIFFLLVEISTYLTITEIYNLHLTCKEYREILRNIKLWNDIINKTYNISFMNPVDITNIIMLSISLDKCIICEFCLSKTCNNSCIYTKKISKTDSINYYLLTKDDLATIAPEVKYNNFFKKNITLFNHQEVRQLVCEKYCGYSNFKIFREKIDNIKHEKRNIRLKNLEMKEKEFQEWRLDYIGSFDYSNLTNNERLDLVNKKLNEYGIVYNPETDPESEIFMNFVNGYLVNMSVEHIAVLLKLQDILYSYHEVIYLEFYHDISISLDRMMCKKRGKPNYTWHDALIDIYKKYEPRILKFINSIVIIG
jgi:hypothetical protein